ncbi:TetR/AcrR family transcriptional regulator [Cupriavidus basilensis]|uniref:TetR/AcrR family transcriptional regulator n=1 Tax=Cupriavidus basilensis TaxID=68895 RepID=UPI00130E04FE|nr:TetR/AcrR family transcriptional regulator [Cupriavidus basilensis]
MKSTATSSTKRRRTQAERTQETQQKLVRGAIALLKRKRYTGFRTADVAEEAGVSKGAQTHHFPSKDMLVLEALEEVYRQTQENAMKRIAQAKASPEEFVELLVADSESFFLSDDFLLSLDLMMVDPQSPLGVGVKELAQRYRLPVEKAWVDALIDAGNDRAKVTQVVGLTYALARGFGVRQLISDPGDDFHLLMQSWLETARAMLEHKACSARPSRTPRAVRKAG